MASLNSLIRGQAPKERTGGFPVTMVHYSKLIPSENNNYSTDNIEELARAILLSGGIKQNLLARKKSPDEYELIAGHRRRLAVKYLVEEMGLDDYAMVPVHVEKDGDVISEINLILANCSMRERTDWEKMMEVTRLTELVKALQSGTEEEQERFRRLFGKEPSMSGRELRKAIAESLGLSETKVANLRHIEGSLVPELKEKFQAGEIGVSVANEAAGLPAEEQVELSKKEKIQLSDVREKAVSESDTEEQETEEQEAKEQQSDPSCSCPPQIAGCRRTEWGTGPEEQRIGAKECSRCWEAWREKQRVLKTAEDSRKDGELPEMAPAQVDYEWEEEEGSREPDGLLEPEGIKTYDRKILEQMIAEEENLMGAIGEYWKKDLPECYTQEAMKIQAYRNLLAEHDAAEAAGPGLVENPDLNQPELPNFRNDDQRKAWIEDYKAWGLWYRDEHIDVNYYKFDFPNGSRLVAVEYLQRESIWNSGPYDDVVYHLIEKNKQKYGCMTTYDDKFQYHSSCETELVKYLKKIQKKGGKE